MLSEGIYERLLDQELEDLLASHPELKATFEKIEPESTPQAYSQFVAQVVRSALQNSKAERRLELTNRLLQILGAEDGLDYTQKKLLLARSEPFLRQIRLDQPGRLEIPRPQTPLSFSTLFTGSGDDPQLERELRLEMLSADRVDILVAFIKWSGLQLLLPAFEELVQRRIPVRIITTSYMGASDPKAVEWLASKPGFSVRVSYDTERTRLHAKAYHFVRKTGFSTAYIGSANMTRPAMTSGLEWTVKVTAQDMPHILERFEAEFETYWAQPEFIAYDTEEPARFRDAIAYAKNAGPHTGLRFFADVRPHAFQERILEALSAARINGSNRNLVVAATGTGKTVIAAFDYARHLTANPESSRLLFAVHRKEILQQAMECFRTVLRDQNFGELLVDGITPRVWNHVFASVQSLTSREPWVDLGDRHFDFVILDEAHHGTAPSYRPLLDHLRPVVLLGLTATPERMDGSSILPDFDNQFAAEIRLPEALEEKLLCPFHYFGVTDPISTADDRFWKNGKYDTDALTNVYTGNDLKALQRLDVIIQSIHRYQPDLNNVRAVGFCCGVAHARYMAEKFREAGFTADYLVGETPAPERDEKMRDFRQGKITFLFVVDIMSEGVDVPEINLVLFLRPTESLTVFLQQLGRGLRHAPEKDCLTVLDFVGQSHRKYRVDRKFSALLRNGRRRIDREIEEDFPNLPPGCSIQLERVARETLLAHIRESLGNIDTFIPESINSFEAETKLPLTFANFIRETNLSPVAILRKRTWSEWKDKAAGTKTVDDPDIKLARAAMSRIALRTDPEFLNQVIQVSESKVAESPAHYGLSDAEANALHYTFWSGDGQAMGVSTHQESFARWLRNPKSAEDMVEIALWRRSVCPYPTQTIDLGYPCHLRLHATYGSREVTAAFSKANLQTTGPTGTGVIHIKEMRTYIHFVTFRKEEKDFAPTTRYKDYPISRDLLHWQSQSTTTQESETGQNYINFRDRAYTILFFARVDKSTEGETSPFVFLGPATNLVNYEGNRPISMTWELAHPMPAELYEAGRAV